VLGGEIVDFAYKAVGRLCLAGRSSSRWRPTWRELVAQEPALAAAEAAVAFTGRPLRSAEWLTIEGVVADRVGPFGVNALDPLLGEAAAYEAAMEHLRKVSAGTRRPWGRRRRRW
jgi:hypothetical protein